MSSTITADHTARTAAGSSPTVGRVTPTYDEVIAAIIDDAHWKGVECDIKKADGIYHMLVRAREAHKDGEGMYHLGEGELVELHDVFEAIMPDPDPGQRVPTTIAPNSAYALLNERLLGDRTLTFVHTRDRTRGAVYCAIAIEVCSF